jgi:hypothetical protein
MAPSATRWKSSPIRVRASRGRGHQGQDLAFTSETSNSGFKAPSAILKAEYGMVAGEDFEPVFSGKHDNSILGVANKDLPRAAIANSVMGRMIEREVITADQVKSIYKSQTFPTTGFGTVYNLTPELQDKIKEAFFTFPWEGTALAEEFGSRNGEASSWRSLQGFLGCDPQDRRGQWRRIRPATDPRSLRRRACLRGRPCRFVRRGPMLELKNCPRPIKTGDKALQDVTLTVPKGQVMG